MKGCKLLNLCPNCFRSLDPNEKKCKNCGQEIKKTVRC